MAVTTDFLVLIAPLAAWAASKKRVRRAWIYGSRLKGTQQPDSDLDMALEIGPLETDDEALGHWILEKDTWQRELQKLSPYRIQLEWYGREATPKIQKYLDCCSMLIYERAS